MHILYGPWVETTADQQYALFEISFLQQPLQENKSNNLHMLFLGFSQCILLLVILTSEILHYILARNSYPC